MPIAPDVTMTMCRPAREQGFDLGGHPAEVRGVDPAIGGQGVRADLDDHSFCFAEIAHNFIRRHYTSRRRPFKAKHPSPERDDPGRGEGKKVRT